MNITFPGLLTIVFITLKLLGKIDWSWLLVLSPVLVPIVLKLGIIMFGVLIFTLLGKPYKVFLITSIIGLSIIIFCMYKYTQDLQEMLEGEMEKNIRLLEKLIEGEKDDTTKND